MERRDAPPRWRPPSLTAGLPFVVPALILTLGLALLALQPSRFSFRQQPLMPSGEPLLPVDALGVAHHDFAYVTGGRDVVLERLMYGSRKIVWQTTLAVPARLTGAVDVTGTGLDALCLSGTGARGPTAIVLDRDGQRIAQLTIPSATPEEQAALSGARLVIRFAVTQEGRRKLLACLDRASGEPTAEIILFDLGSGRPEWRVPLATEPSTVLPADLDGDGRSEFLLSTISSPSAPDSALCAVLALSETGSRLWTVPLAPGFATSGTAVMGHMPHASGALVVATSRPLAPGTQSGRIALIEGPTGRVHAAREFRSGLGRPLTLSGGAPRVAVGSREGTLRLFDDNLQVVAERHFGAPIEVEECADLNHDGRLELVAATSREALILDERLRTRAVLRLPRPANDVPDVRLASAGFGNTRLVISGSPSLVADIDATPPIADPIRLSTVGSLALVVGAWLGVRRSRRSSGRGLAGAVAREFLLDYHQIRHETFGRERPFARVRLWAQAQVAGHPLPAEVLETARDEFHRIGAPTLLRFARRAGQLGVSRHQVRQVERLSRQVEEALESACAVTGAQTMVEGALATMTALSEECLAAYREVALRDVCRPDHEAQEAILAKRAVLDRHGVALDLHVDPSGKQPVLFDSMELRALIGELLENGARALAHTTGAEVRVTVAGKPGDARWVVVQVEDNGPGMPTRDAAFAPGGSSHPEGGFGLHRSREIAHRWLAELTLEERGEVPGAMVTLSLRSLLPHDAVAAGDVPTHPPIEEDA